MNTLTHYASKPRTLNRGRTYQQERPDSFVHKPRGLWVSADGEDDWPAWCINESFSLGALSCAHRVTLADDANILWVTTPQDFIAFHQVYARRVKDELHGYGELRDESIDWPQVASEYNGIVIAPYMWGFRLSHMWYYGWDCASGCIWNFDAIAEFTLMPDHANRFRELIIDNEEVSQ